MIRNARAGFLAAFILILFFPVASSAQLASGLRGAAGSAVGPDGAIYATEAAVGFITRIDPETGETALFASGLPTPLPHVGFGGALDVAFLGGVAYALVTMVDATLGGSEVTGVYRMDDEDSFTPIADIGAFALANPPCTPFDLPTGVQYSLQAYRGGFLVTDGHHNRVLRVRLNGEVTEFRSFDNIVPTGLDIRGGQIYMAQAGPAPHLPEDGKVVVFDHNSGAEEIASGAMLAVDVELGRGRVPYVLAQGEWDEAFPGSPALPNTGALYRIHGDGTLSTIEDQLNLPSSLEIINNNAYIINLLGEVWVIEDIGQPPFGAAH